MDEQLDIKQSKVRFVIYPNYLFLILLMYLKFENPEYFKSVSKPNTGTYSYHKAFARLEYETPHSKNETELNKLVFVDICTLTYTFMDIINNHYKKEFDKYLKFKIKDYKSFDNIKKRLFDLLEKFTALYDNTEFEEFNLQNLLNFFGASSITETTFCLACGTKLEIGSNLICDYCKSIINPNEQQDNDVNAEKSYIIRNSLIHLFLVLNFLKKKRKDSFDEFVAKKISNFIRLKFSSSYSDLRNILLRKRTKTIPRSFR